MRIIEMSLTNIRSHRETTLALERITTIAGLNHAGKSSIEQAIEIAFARRSEITGVGGQGQTDLLRFGQDQGVIDLALDLDGVPVELRASLTKRSGLNVTLRNPNDKDWNPVALAQDLKADADVLSCLCNNRFFIDMKPADQKSLLASIILPSTYAWPEHIKADLHRSRITPNWGASPFVLIEACYKWAFDKRTVVNRDIKDWRPPQDSGKYDGPPVEDIRQVLATRQKERTDLAVEQQRLSGAITQAAQAEGNHKRRALEAKARIETEKKERATIAEAALSKAAIKKLETEAAGLAKAEALDAEAQGIILELGQIKKTLEKLNALGEEGRCPTCTQILDDETFSKIATPFIEQQNSLLSRQAAKLDERKALGNPAGAQQKLHAALTVEQDLARIDKRIADLERTVKSATEEAEKVKPEELPKPDSLDEKIADLDARIQKGTGYLEAAARAEGLRGEAEKAQTKKKELDEDLACLERLVTYFGPKGIKAELIAQYIGGFEQRVNAVLGKWGYSCALSIEPWSFVVSRAGSRYSCQLHMLSRSEKLRFADAFSVALAVVSGWGFVVLDDSESIVGDDLSMLYRLLYESELDQAILMLSVGQAKTNKLPGTCFIQLDETIEQEISTSHAKVLASTPR